MKRAIICDIDGTLTNDAMSIPLDIDVRKSKDEFYDAVNGYEPKIYTGENNTLLLAYGKSTGIRFNWSLIKSLDILANNGIELFFVTAREDDDNWNTRYNTLNLLRRMFGSKIKDEQLLMRPYGDYRVNHEVKKELVQKYIIDKGYNILYALDDEEGNVNMFQNMGILTLQVKQL